MVKEKDETTLDIQSFDDKVMLVFRSFGFIEMFVCYTTEYIYNKV